MDKVSSFFSRFLNASHTENESDPVASQRFSAIVLFLVGVGWGSLSIIMNVWEGNSDRVLLLGILVLTSLFGIVWAKYMKGGIVSLSVISLFLLVMSSYFILQSSVPGGYHLLWLFMFPPILIFCMGLRTGTILCGVFYLALIFFFFFPYDPFQIDEYPLAMRLRLLLVMFGSFTFSWLTELSRYRLRRALMLAINRLEREALIDPLTGLGNRRDFYNSLSWIQAQASRSAIPFSIAIIDADHFKSVNDTYGHSVGDEVLQHITRIVSDHLRATDRVFRWGGEEFIILMPETRIDEARLVCERLRQQIEKTPYDHQGTDIPLTICLGLYCGPVNMEIEEQIAQADLNLYEAKRTGRNRVCG